MQSIPGVIDAQSGYANFTGQADAVHSLRRNGNPGVRISDGHLRMTPDR